MISIALISLFAATSAIAPKDVSFTGVDHAPETLVLNKDQDGQLIDSVTQEVIPNNEITLVKGQQLIIRTAEESDFDGHDDKQPSKTFYNSYHFMHMPGNTQDETPSLFSRENHDMVNPDGCHISYFGPCFLLTATKTGTVTFNIYFAQYTTASVAIEFSWGLASKCIEKVEAVTRVNKEYGLLHYYKAKEGSITVNVIDAPVVQ